MIDDIHIHFVKCIAIQLLIFRHRTRRHCSVLKENVLLQFTAWSERHVAGPANQFVWMLRRHVGLQAIAAPEEGLAEAAGKGPPLVGGFVPTEARPLVVGAATDVAGESAILGMRTVMLGQVIFAGEPAAAHFAEEARCLVGSTWSRRSSILTGVVESQGFICRWRWIFGDLEVGIIHGRSSVRKKWRWLKRREQKKIRCSSKFGQEFRVFIITHLWKFHKIKVKTQPSHLLLQPNANARILLNFLPQKTLKLQVKKCDQTLLTKQLWVAKCWLYWSATSVK